MRIASEIDLAPAVARFAEVRPRLTDYRADMLDHPTAGRSLRNYLILVECPELLIELGLSETERFWSRYYWLARFAREWQAVSGCDAGLEQQLFQLLESADHCGIAYDALPDVEAAALRDALVLPAR